VGSLIAILRWFFIRLNQLNISTQGKSKIFLDVSTVQEIVAFNGKIQLWIYRIESGKIAAFLAWNAIAEEVEIDLCCTRQIFLESPTTSLRVRWYIASHNYIKTFNWVRSRFEAPVLQVHCEVGLHCWTVDWAAKSTAVPFEWIKSLWSVSAGNKSTFSFSNYIPLSSCFLTTQLFLKPSTETKFNQKTTSAVRWRPQALISTNLWNKLRGKIVIEIRECGR